MPCHSSPIGCHRPLKYSQRPAQLACSLPACQDAPAALIWVLTWGVGGTAGHQAPTYLVPGACSGPKMGCVAKHSKGRYASCDEHRSHTRGHSEERDQKSGVLWHENEKIQPPQFGRASGQTRDLDDIGYSARPRPFQAVPFISSVRCGS